MAFWYDNTTMESAPFVAPVDDDQWLRNLRQSTIDAWAQVGAYDVSSMESAPGVARVDEGDWLRTLRQNTIAAWARVGVCDCWSATASSAEQQAADAAAYRARDIEVWRLMVVNDGDSRPSSPCVGPSSPTTTAYGEGAAEGRVHSSLLARRGLRQEHVELPSAAYRISGTVGGKALSSAKRLAAYRQELDDHHIEDCQPIMNRSMFSHGLAILERWTTEDVLRLAEFSVRIPDFTLYSPSPSPSPSPTDSGYFPPMVAADIVTPPYTPPNRTHWTCEDLESLLLKS